MKPFSVLLASAFLLSTTLPAMADAPPFVPPTGEQTLICTNANLTQYPSAYNYCYAVVIPYVCDYITAYGTPTTPAYMALWTNFCIAYEAGRIQPPPPV